MGSSSMSSLYFIGCEPRLCGWILPAGGHQILRGYSSQWSRQGMQKRSAKDRSLDFFISPRKPLETNRRPIQILLLVQVVFLDVSFMTRTPEGFLGTYYAVLHESGTLC
jgi:hypothetical protein